MRFHTFLKGLDKTSDPDIQVFTAWCNTQQKLPQSSDPALPGLFFSGKLDLQQATGYKKAMMLYFASDSNQLPKDCKDQKVFMQRINIL